MLYDFLSQKHTRVQVLISYHVQMCNAWFLSPLEEAADTGKGFLCN